MGRSLPSLSLFLFHPGFRPQATAHVLLQILVKKLKWIHEWSDTGTHGVSAVAKCATTDDSNRGFFATRARLGRSPNNNSTSSRAGEDDLSSLFDRLAVSVVCFPPTFLFFFSLSLFPFISSASIFRDGGIILSTRRKRKKSWWWWWWIFRWMSFYVWGIVVRKVIVPLVEYFSSFRV